MVFMVIIEVCIFFLSLFLGVSGGPFFFFCSGCWIGGLWE
jgi:hypothetical protein